MNTMKRLTLFLVILTIFLSTILPVQAAAADSPSLDGIQIFPEDNIWNTRVDNLPVDAKSDVYINDLITDAAPYSNLRHYISTAIPYNVVNSTQSHQYITRFGSLAYSDNVSYPIPDDPLFEQGCSDHHMEIIDTDEMVLYELYAAEKMADGSWHAGSGAVWDLQKNLFRKNNETPMWATDEAGLPIFPGLVRYDEVSTGYINHSLRISVPALQNTWIWPARTSSPLPGVDNPLHPPAGERFRLNASFDISGYPPQARVILQALKTYGAMATTNNGANMPVSIVGSPDTRWNYTDLNTLWQVSISDFEAVDVSSLMIDKNSAQALQISGIPPSTITVTSPDGGEIWQLDNAHMVTWSYSGSPGPYVNILLLKAGTEVGTIASSVPIGSAGTGSSLALMNVSGTTGSDYTVRVQSTSQPSITDTSDTTFTLTSESITPAITITAPLGGETWQRGTTHTIAWDFTGNPGSSVKIMLVKSGVEVGTISAGTSTGTSGKGTYTWEIYPSGSTGNDYRVRVQSISQPSVTNTSNNNFTLTSDAITPVITVTAPLGGETWQRGTTHTVTWDYTGNPGPSVKIILVKSGVEAGIICAGTSTGSGGKGAYTWEIYPSGSTGNDYRVRVQSISQPSVTNTTNSNFTMTSALVAPVAAFTGTPLLGTAPLDVTFTDASTGVISGYFWDFGDTAASTEKNPSHSYTTAGTYTVNLTVSGPGGSNTTIHTGYITVSEAPPVAKFSGIPVTGIVPLTVTFSDASTGVISGYFWDFGDTTTSTEKNPSHQYTAAGTYTVNLTVSGPGGSNSSTQTGYITVGEDPPVAKFSGAPISGIVPLTVTFTDASTGIISGYAWDFGDTTTSTGKNPSHTYTTAGTYTVNLTVSGPGGFNTTIQTGYITVSEAPIAITVTSPNGGETWQRGTSQTVSWKYTGTPGSTVKIVLMTAGIVVGTINSSVPLGSGGTGSYTWAIPSSGSVGNFKVSVQSISQPTIRDTSNNNFTLISAPPLPVITITTPNGGETWQRGTPQTVTWNYTGSPGSTVKIVLMNAGVVVGTINSGVLLGSGGTGSYTWVIPSSRSTGSEYKVRIESISQPAIRDMSDTYFTITSAPPLFPPSAGFSTNVTSGNAPLAVRFTDTSTGSPTMWNWSFGDTSWYNTTTASEKNPTHTYSSDGTFTAKLTVCNASGCNTTVPGMTITVGTTTSSVTVTSPENGEAWKQNSSHTITWTYTGNPGSTVKIELLKGGVFYQLVKSGTPIGSAGSGSYPWTIRTITKPGTDYKIRVTSTSNPAYNDTGNANFTIN